VIVAFGFEYVVMAVNNARSIRRTNPGLPVALITNAPPTWSFLGDEFDRVVHLDEPDERNRSAKLGAWDHATADRVLYLDADAEVTGDLAPAFALLDRFDLLLRPFELPAKVRHRLTSDVRGELFPQFMGGILFFRRTPATQRFFHRWADRYERSGVSRDQPALARAVLDTDDVRILPMNAVWGAMTKQYASGTGRVPSRLVHYGDVEHDGAVLTRCREALDDILAALPTADLTRPEVLGTRLRYARLSSPLYRSPLLRPIARRWWAWRDRTAARGFADPRHKQVRITGQPLGDDDPLLWED
jgi:hypothetical protein